MSEEIVDLVVVGGGINGVGIARDAAGRGLSVVLLEKGDLGEGTSSRSGKYIHGGLRYLEYYEFRLVREALIEREVVLGIAPQLTWPLKLVLPHSPEQRPRWLIRLGLFLYDHIGGRKQLPPTEALDLGSVPEGQVIRPTFKHAFAYYDVWVDDARLVVLNALDAAERGARVLSRTRFETARREAGHWRIRYRDESSGETTHCLARALVNAAGPWVENVIHQLPEVETRRRVRLVKGSHLILKRWWNGEHGYVLQHNDRRLIFVNPYFDDLALVGTTDVPYDAAAESVTVSDDEIDYLLDVLRRYFERDFSPDNVLHSYAGVRPLYDDDSSKNASAVTRDYTFELDEPAGGAPALSVFGGKLTTYRRLSEHALERLQRWFPDMGAPWTGSSALPGGDLGQGDFDAWLAGFRSRHAWLPASLARHLARCYGSRADTVLVGCDSIQDLGRHFGGMLYEREALWLVEQEWACTSEDILWRRTKHGLFIDAEQRDVFDQWMRQGNRGHRNGRDSDEAGTGM